MSELATVIFSVNDEERALLQMQTEGTAIARVACALGSFPVAASDPLMRRVRDAAPAVILVDIPAQPAQALDAIEILHAEFPSAAVFAIGEMKNPQTIVSAMRAGAREFLERPVTTTNLLEAFVRLTASRRRTTGTGKRGKVTTVINAKGGCGATTIAVNTALSVVSERTGVALVDLAPIGHASLHLNLKPSFTIKDVLANLHRLDSSLLEGYMTRHASGVHLLGGIKDLGSGELPSVELARLFDLLVTHYSQVIVDISGRYDSATRIVCDLSDNILVVAQTDLPSLWGAARVHEFLSQGAARERARVVLNRFRKLPGFSDGDVEKATSMKLFWKIPGQYQGVSSAIDSGIPVASRNHSDIARTFVEMGAILTNTQLEPKRSSWSIFKSA